MLARRSTWRMRVRAWCAFYTCASLAFSQTPASTQIDQNTPVFHASSRLVVVNVVATDHDGNPISGLQKDDFEIAEDGKPQQIRVFEPHVPARQPSALPDLHLGADEYTNFPKLAANSSINVVLFDILNTPTTDQMFARQQMIDFLKTLPRGHRVALFTLGSELRMVAGFTTSTEELIAAAYKVRPGLSTLLDSDDEQRQENHVQSVLLSGIPSSASSVSQRMQDFSSETRLVRQDVRVQQTFEAMGALARSLSGYAGRKNLLWLSEAFPASLLPSREDSHQSTRNYLAIFQKYSGLMEASQISVYPIDLRGLKNTSLQGTGGSPEFASGNARNLDMIGSQMTMRDVADQTGGHAFYNTNDLKLAMQKSIEHGATYYTIAYSPQNENWNGDFRHIAVKPKRPDVKLDYRRGYYATKDQPDPIDANHRMLVAEMQPGVPESTMLLMRVKVVVNETPTDNVSIDYGVYAPDLAFSGPDALKHAKLEFVAVAWDSKNKAAGNVSQTEELDLRPESYQKMMNTGVPAHENLTLKPGRYQLRMGVMDYSTGKIGTMEIPLSVPSTTATK